MTDNLKQRIAEAMVNKYALGGAVTIDELAQAVLDIVLLRTDLKDRLGRDILVGQVVHWTDGGDNLSIDERIKTRWDRIAVVNKSPDIQFTVIDSPSEPTKEGGHTFHYGNFIYKDTARYLTIVAESQEEYHQKFANAGDCMRWVLSQTTEKVGA